VEAEDCKRAKLILLVAKGYSFSEIGRRLDCTDRYISVWKRRFQHGRLSGLDSRYRGSQRRVRTAQMEAKILEATRKGPRDGTTHWSSYRLAKYLGVSHTTVYRVWRQFGIQATPAAALYGKRGSGIRRKSGRHYRIVSPTAGAAARSSVWMKRAPSRHLIGLIRCCRFPRGEPSVMALSTIVMAPFRCMLRSTPAPGEVLGKTSSRHTSGEFVQFLDQIVASQPKEKEIHIIADNLSAHKTKEVSVFLQANPHLRIHYTPTYSSWLNQVENWFSKIQRQYHRARCLQLRQRSGTQDHAFHPQL